MSLFFSNICTYFYNFGDWTENTYCKQDETYIKLTIKPLLKTDIACEKLNMLVTLKLFKIYKIFSMVLCDPFSLDSSTETAFSSFSVPNWLKPPLIDLTAKRQLCHHHTIPAFLLYDNKPVWEREVNKELKVMPQESLRLRHGFVAPSTFPISSLTRWPPSQEWNSALDGEEEWQVLESASTVNIHNVSQKPEHNLIFNLTIWHTRGKAILPEHAVEIVIVLAIKPQKQLCVKGSIPMPEQINIMEI